MDIVEFATSVGYITGLILGVSIWLIPDTYYLAHQGLENV